MDDFVYTEYSLNVRVGNQLTFVYKFHHVEDRGFFFAMPWKEKDLKLNEKRIQPMGQGTRLRVVGITNEEDYTRPPDYLKESELIALMDQKGIGTDASIPQHIQNICDRRYCSVCRPGEDGRPGAPFLTEQQIYNMRRKNPSAQIEQPKSRRALDTPAELRSQDSYATQRRNIGSSKIGGFQLRYPDAVSEVNVFLLDIY
eukprot:TRINITY_DN8674_c0_g1_i1.p1 TRINITY_DN8674_c0_g1~~TRINITY_DN8674_c0_g1_i1.p1  ORF type:complete len:200 (-),score=27.98 TRINITY_DN8674_c0_g1_i1:32-631(-)